MSKKTKAAIIKRLRAIPHYKKYEPVWMNDIKNGVCPLFGCIADGVNEGLCRNHTEQLRRLRHMSKSERLTRRESYANRITITMMAEDWEFKDEG